MFTFTQPVSNLIEQLKKIPGIGRKSAQRICFYLLKTREENARDLARAITEARDHTFYCSICNNITSQDPCEICIDVKRDRSKICVVEEPFNIVSIERTNLFTGLYHVLLGNLSPIRGIGPDELKIDGLVARLDVEGIEEIILALSPTTEGNATAHYLNEILNRFDIKVSRIALGLPIGADLDYVDQVTIARALEERVRLR